MAEAHEPGIIDVTLREGERAPGIYYSAERKVEIARVLAELGIEWIELGNPAADSALDSAITKVVKANVGATIGAVARPRLDDVKSVVGCGVGLLTTNFTASSERLRIEYELEEQRARDLVHEAVAYARSQRRDLVIRHSIENVAESPIEATVAMASTAIAAGANIIGLVNSTGRLSAYGEHPVSASYIVQEVRQRLGEAAKDIRFSIECRNDLGLATANALEAVAAGADLVNAGVLGLGEGTGVTDTAELLVNLRETFNAGTKLRMFVLNRLYGMVSRYARRIINFNHPLVGQCAFTHYSGIHVKAVREDPGLYQSLDPQEVGRGWSLALGAQSGRASIELALELVERPELTSDKELVGDILEQVKALGKSGSAIELGQAFLGIVWRCEQKRQRMRKSA